MIATHTAPERIPIVLRPHLPRWLPWTDLQGERVLAGVTLLLCEALELAFRKVLEFGLPHLEARIGSALVPPGNRHVPNQRGPAVRAFSGGYDGPVLSRQFLVALPGRFPFQPPCSSFAQRQHNKDLLSVKKWVKNND